LYPKLVKCWTDKNSRVRREIMNAIGNFVKSNSNHLATVNEPENMRIFDKNSNHVWNSLSYYWQQPIQQPSLGAEEKVSSNDSDSV